MGTVNRIFLNFKITSRKISFPISDCCGEFLVFQNYFVGKTKQDQLYSARKIITLHPVHD